MPDLYTPENLRRWSPGSGASSWDSAANYCGEDFSAFYLAPIHKTRDTADSLTLSNWQVISAELDACSQHDDTGETTIGHWACGWFAVYLIHETDTAALKCADKWAARLADYPVASEDALSELEQEAESEAWDSYGSREWRDAIRQALIPYAPEDLPDAARFGQWKAAEFWADDLADDLSDEQLYNSWHELTERCSWSVQHESDGPSFNIADPAELLTAEILSGLTGLPLLPADQQWRREPYPWEGADHAPLLA